MQMHYVIAGFQYTPKEKLPSVSIAGKSARFTHLKKVSITDYQPERLASIYNQILRDQKDVDGVFIISDAALLQLNQSLLTG